VVAALRGLPVSASDAAAVLDLRLPRTVIGLSAGIALGVSGALIQAVTRNPLADPGILGVTAGSAFFVSLAVGFLGVTTAQGYLWFAFLGALVATVAVYVIGTAGRGRVSPARLILAGVALGAVLTGVVSSIRLADPKSFEVLQVWESGSLQDRGWDVAAPVIPLLGVGLLLAVFLGPSLNAVAVGDDLAASLGTNVLRTRVLAVLAVTILAGGATAMAGPIAFVGLMIPHIARWIVGPDQRWIIAMTVLLSPVLLIAADILARVVLRPGELPVGVVTAIVGAPVLIVLVRRRRVSGL
jgi:iron complex transport system permease protein